MMSLSSLRLTISPSNRPGFRQQEEIPTMSKKLIMRLAPLVVVAAFFVIPAAAQATDHFHIALNPAPEEEGKKVQFISWGLLTLTSDAPGSTAAECENASTGYVENPVGGGAGKILTEGWEASNCKNAGCEEPPASGKLGVFMENENVPGLSVSLHWPGELVGATNSTIRIKSETVRVWTHCQVGHEPPVTKAAFFNPAVEERSYTEYAVGSTTCHTGGGGSSTPLVKNEVSAQVPSKLVYDSGSGKLECGSSKGTTGGSSKVCTFYGPCDVITAKIN
jgi:hypothetical protein